MAAYGAFISAPMGHVLISILQKLFSGRTSLRAKILQIIASNLIVCPSCHWSPYYANELVKDCSYPEHRVSRVNGHHRWRENIPPSPCDMEGRFHACHEGQLGRIPPYPCLCAEVPSRTHLGPILQRGGFRRRHIRQLGNKEEAPCSPEKETPGREQGKQRRLSRSTKVLDD
jgi:hypothetical protein